jgi:signal peptidase I
MAKKTRPARTHSQPAPGAPEKEPTKTAAPKPAKPLGFQKPLWLKTGTGKFIQDVVIIIGLFVIIRLWGIEANVIPSGSMEDTLLVGDHILADKFTYLWRDPRVGEIVTFTYPYRDMSSFESVRFFLRHFLGELPNGPTLLIKRVQGVPGDRLQLKNDVLYRNGRPVKELYIKGGAGADWPPDGVPYVVPPDHYFVMGDNRYNSYDARFIGPVPRKYIMGKAEIMYFSIAPVKCAQHNVEPIKTNAGWQCPAGGEILREWYDFEPVARGRFDERIRWSRVGRLVRFLR